MKKFLTSIFGIAAALLVFVGCPTSPEPTASLTLDKNALVITSALGGYTNQTLTATLENSSASLEWYTTNSNIVSVSPNGSTATLICEGTQGTARVGVVTSDGELEAYCTVSVVLSETPAQALTDVTVVEGSQTVSGFTLNWNYPAISSAAVIDIFESSEAQDAANKLAASSSSEEPTVYKTYTVKRDVLSSSTSGTYTISDLLSNAEGKTYYYSAYGFLNGKRSTSYSNGNAKLIADSTAPGNVENVEATFSDHTIVLTWTEPANEDYESVTVSISPAKDFAGSDLADNVKTQTLKKGTTTAKFENLAAETEHTFTFKTADSNGNLQGDTNNASAGSTAMFTTLKDETAPAGVSGLTATFTVNGNVVVSWTDPEDVDFKQVVVSATTSTDGITAPESQTISAGTKTATFSCDTSADYTFTAKTYDYNSNEGTAVSAEATKPTVSDVNMSENVSCSVIWTEPASADGYTYSYEVAAYTSGSDTAVVTKDVKGGIGVCAFFDEIVSNTLSFGTTYTFKVSTVVKEIANETNTATYTSSSTVTSALKKVILSLSTMGTYDYNKDRLWLLTAGITSGSASGYHVIEEFTASAANTSNYVDGYSAITYTSWLVLPSLNNPTDTDEFSLMATDDKGTVSGYYMYGSTTRNVTSGWYYTKHWSAANHLTSSTSRPHFFVGKPSEDTYYSAEAASFKKVETSGYSLQSAQSGYDSTNFYLTTTIGSTTYNLVSVDTLLEGSTSDKTTLVSKTTVLTE